MKKSRAWRIGIIAVALLILAECYYIRKDVKKSTIDILNGSYAMFSQVGQVDGVHHQLHGTGGHEGFVAYGPYLSLNPGSYLLTYSLVLDSVNSPGDQERTIGKCDVNFVGSPDKNKTVELTIKDFKKDNRCKIILDFSLSSISPQTEFRLYQNHGVVLSLVGLQLRPLLKDLLLNRESEFFKFNVRIVAGALLLFLVFFFGKAFVVTKHKLKIVVFVLIFVFMEMWCFYRDQLLPVIPGAKMFTQVGVINEKTGEIRGVGAQNGFLAFGPYYPLAEGNYVVTYTIKLNNLGLNDNPDREVGVADINVVGFEKSNVAKGIKIKDFDLNNTAKVVIRFQAPQGNPQMEYRVFQYGGNDLSIKSIKFHPTAAHYLKKYYKMHLDFIGMALLAAIVLV